MPCPNGAKCAHAAEGEVRCKKCQVAHRQREAERRAERKRKRLCWVGGCASKCAPGLTSCEAHRGTSWRS